MLSQVAQEFFANKTFEYPLAEGVAVNPGLVPLSEIPNPGLTADKLSGVRGTQQLLRQTPISSSMKQPFDDYPRCGSISRQAVADEGSVCCVVLSGNGALEAAGLQIAGGQGSLENGSNETAGLDYLW